MRLVVGLIIVLSGCGGIITYDQDGGTGGHAGTGGGAGGGGVGATGGGTALDGLPCEVATVIADKCSSCHGPTVALGAPYPLIARAQFLEAAPGQAGQTKGQRSLTRMQLGTMPPVNSPAVTSAELNTFATWISAGMPSGSCAPDAGVVIGPQPTTCASGSYWLGGTRESVNMEPGFSCQGCHVTRKPERNYFFMGTVFPEAHAKDTCNAEPPTGVKVEILDKHGTVVLTMTARPTSGNFYNDSLSALDATNQPIMMPYTARVVGPGGVMTMTTPQTSGDCNSCHTEQGTNDATGRIVFLR